MQQTNQAAPVRAAGPSALADWEGAIEQSLSKWSASTIDDRREKLREFIPRIIELHSQLSNFADPTSGPAASIHRSDISDALDEQFWRDAVVATGQLQRESAALLRRLVLLLSELYDVSGSEIARESGMPQSTISRWIKADAGIF